MRDISTRTFSVRRFLRVSSLASVIQVITVAKARARNTHAQALAHTTHNGRRSKFYPHLAIIQPCWFILLETCASVQLPPPLLFPFAHQPLCLPRVVTYTIAQRANIDKSVGAKTSEGLVTPGTVGCIFRLS